MSESERGRFRNRVPSAGVGAEVGGWEWIASVPAIRQRKYAYTAETLFDRSDVTSGLHQFMLVAHTIEPGVFYLSDPVSGFSQGMPERFACRSNYTNPFTARTTLSYSVSRASVVSVEVSDLLGRQVARLRDVSRLPGFYESILEMPPRIPAGVYFAVLLANGQVVDTRRLTIIR